LEKDKQNLLINHFTNINKKGRRKNAAGPI